MKEIVTFFYILVLTLISPFYPVFALVCTLAGVVIAVLWVDLLYVLMSMPFIFLGLFFSMFRFNYTCHTLSLGMHAVIRGLTE